MEKGEEAPELSRGGGAVWAREGREALMAASVRDDARRVGFSAGRVGWKRGDSREGGVASLHRAE